MAEQFRSMHNEFEARIDAVRSDIKHLDNIAELRERLASVEAKLAQRNQAATIYRNANLWFYKFEHEAILGVIDFPEGLRARILGIAQNV
jgi:hypothetical protein